MEPLWGFQGRELYPPPPAPLKIWELQATRYVGAGGKREAWVGSRWRLWCFANAFCCPIDAFSRC